MQTNNNFSGSHIGLQVTERDFKNLYLECLGGTIIDEKLLSADRAMKLFYIAKPTKVFYVNIGTVLFELFIHQASIKNTFNHICLKCKNAEEVKKKCINKNYPTIDDKNKFFIKDNNGNTLEIFYNE